ncbi:hypothetical protein [Methanolapillus millepedarum]|uniref:Uncharacterized protein n=1 Tax=Methanolapillus millepedarum TaxID=3028296 RepID=A0AA96ZV22_9EURY|nr:hypothetical protein MsAc7_04800 [Methanosarcinaceae archaeon Ac7]
MLNTEEKIIGFVSLLLILTAVVFAAVTESGAIDPDWTLSPEMVEVEGPAGFHYIKTDSIYFYGYESSDGTQIYSTPTLYFFQNMVTELQKVLPFLKGDNNKTPDSKISVSTASSISEAYPGYSGFYVYVTYQEQISPFTLEFWEMPRFEIISYFSKTNNWMKGPGENPNKTPTGFAYVNVVAADSKENATAMAAGLAAFHFNRSGEQDRSIIKAAVNSMPGYRYSYSYVPDESDGLGNEAVTAAGYIWTVDNFLVTVDGYNVDSKPLKLLAKGVRFEENNEFDIFNNF